MTKVYFVRHAEPNYNNRDDMQRELSAKGMADRELVTQFLSDKNIEIVLSSPYKRAIDTVAHFADNKGLNIEIVDDFRERKVDSIWIEDFTSFSKAQWADFDYKLSDGESLNEVQSRNIYALKKVLEKYKDKNIAIGSHGTALSTIINYYDNSFGYEGFEKIRTVMPWIVEFTFQNDKCISINILIYI
ncbi:MAG: histidine phosphatase family protein [Clostridia bacterium]|nr:histidine phosphatase family protein [Clostridia bacterium]